MNKKPTFWRWFMLFAIGLVILSTTTYAQNREIGGDVTSGSVYTAGATLNLDFTISAYSPDWEYIDDFSLVFPADVTINSGTQITGQNAVISGQTISWDTYFNPENGDIDFSVNVTVDIAFTGDMNIDWLLVGEVYGTPPHSASGTVIIPEASLNPGLEILNPTLTMGHRPIGAWMEPARFEIINNPGEGDLSITDAEIDNNYGGFVNVVSPTLPYTLATGETTTEFGLTTNVFAPATAGTFTGDFGIIFSGSRALETATYEGTAYVPIDGDVVENALPLSPPPAPAALVGGSRESNGWYKNYILPNDLGNSPTENDMVFEIAPTEDMLLNITATIGSPVNMAVYAEDFEGEGGPMATNAMVQAYDNLVDVELFADNTYYLVGSSLSAWDATYSLLPMPAPDAVTNVAPLDGAFGIQNGDNLSWTFGNNVSEYELVLGTTYPPTTVVVPYTADLATSYTLAGLQPNMQYFWRVNVRNTQGETEGPVWGFTTTIDVPTDLTATIDDTDPTEATVDVELDWEGPSDRAFLGYIVYRDAIALNTIPLTESDYTDQGVARNISHTYTVTAMFDEGESDPSDAVTITTKGVGIFNGFVRDFLTNDPIEGARVDISGTEGNYSVLTAANGAYSTQAFAGTYDFEVSADDYTSETLDNVVLAHGTTVANDFILMETPYAVGEVVAVELNDDQVQISWSGSRGILSYDVWREKVYQPGTLELIGNVQGQQSQNYVDFDWGIQEWGVYRWAVTVNYDANQVSEPTFSNTLDKDMTTVVDVTVTLNSGDIPAGTLVTFTNTSEPDLELVYEETLGGSGQYTWNDFRKGVYNIEVVKDGYTGISLSAVTIFDETSFEWLLDEVLAPPTGLYVTPTGFATWTGGSAAPFEPFMETFNDGIPAEWTIIDGGTTTDTWYQETPAGNPHSSGASLDGTPFAFVDSDEAGSNRTLDEMLVSPVFDASNAASLYLEFDQYYNFIFSGEYTEVDVFNGTEWVNVLTQTADAGSWSNPDHQIIDVTDHINPAFQVRFHYFDNGSWVWYWAVDNVAINEFPSRGERSFENYKVFHDGIFVTDTDENMYQYGSNGEELIDGETYVAEVASAFTTGQSARASYTWTYIACDNYATPGDFTALQVEGTLNVDLSWTIPTIPAGEDQIDFARITRDGEVIVETADPMYLDENLELGTYEYCITFVYATGAETCPATICETVEVIGGGFVDGNVMEAAYLGGANIEGAVITLTNVDDDAIVFSFTTDADGDYTGEVLAGTYDYAVEADGYVGQTLEDILVAQTATVTHDFVLMEFPYAVGDIVATEISDNAVEVNWSGTGGGGGGGTTEDFFEDFEAGTVPTGWVIYDADGDSYNWENTAVNYDVFDAHSGLYCMTSASYVNNVGALTPNNWLVTPAIEVSAASELKFWIDGQDPSYAAEQYYVKISTTGNEVADFTTTLHDAVATGDWQEITVDLSAYAGETVYIAFQHADITDMFFIKLDDVTVTNTLTRSAFTAPVAAGVSNDMPFRTSGMTQEEIQEMATKFAPTNSSRELQGFNVYRTTCATGDLQFLGYTLDSLFTDNTWGTIEPGVYKWGVEAVYDENASEVSFSNCLDKDMVTQVSVTVITNSNDSPEDTDVTLTNTSEPDLNLVYEVELDATGYFMWEEFRKGTYDVLVEKNGFTPIMESIEIDGPTNLSYTLEELLIPVSDLHVSATGYATWRDGGVVPFEGTSFDFEADEQGWEIQGNVNGWQWGNNASLSSSFMTFDGNSTNFIAVNADAAGSGGSPIVAMTKSPVMNLENAEQIYLSFDYTLRNDAISVHYSIDGGDPVQIEDLAESSGSWTNQTVMLPEEALAENVQIIFLFTEASTWSYGGGVDNVSISEEEPENRELQYYKVWLDGIFVTDTPETFYQYDPATLVPGQEYFSEVAAVYDNGMSAKMDYTWTYYPCDSFPGPEDLAYEVVDVNDVVLTWGGSAPPPPPGEGFEDDFEDHANFAIEFSPWTNVDVDGSDTYGMTGISWPNAYQPQSFIVFNPSATTPVLDGAAAHSGSKYVACFAAVTAPNNDWLISPSVTIGSGYTVSFWAKSYTADYGLERFKVGVSTTGTNPSDFTIITPGSYVEAPAANWTEFSYDLSAYEGQDVYVAIQCVSNDAFFLMVDDFSVGVPATANFAFNPSITEIGSATRETRAMNATMANITPDYSMYSGDVDFVAEQNKPATGIEVGFQNTQTREAVELHYDNGYDNNAVGTGGAVSFMSAVRFTSDELGSYYGDYELTDVKFIIHDNLFTNVTVKVWEGGSYGDPGTEVYSQDVTSQVTAATMTTATLTNAIPLTQGNEYWIGYSVTTTGGYPAAVDAGPMVAGKGAWMYFNNAWDELTNIAATLDYNWVIRGIINTTNGGGGGGGSTFDPGEFLGANVYRNGELIAEMIQEETYTDMDVEPGYYDYCVTFVYEGNAMSCMTSCVEDVLVTEDCKIPQNLTLTEGDANEITLAWNQNISQEFRYDDGTSTGQLGFSGGTISSVLGAKHDATAEITELSWFTTAEGGPHNTVQIYVFGLTSAGMPDGNNVLYTASVTNTDNTWNTHTLPTPVNAEGGFFIALGYNGFAGLGTDDGVGAPYVYQNNTHYYASDYTTNSWTTFESSGFSVNAMIRAIGIVEAKASYAITPEIAPESGVVFDKTRNAVIYLTNDPVETGAPQWSVPVSNMTRALLGYNIYRNGSLHEALWPETTYVYQEGNGGESCYTVTAEYEFCGETDPSNEECVILISVKPNDLSQIKVYPNPSNHTVNIELTSNISQVVIYNYLGQVVLENNITDETTLHIDVRNYEAGAYLVKFVTSEGQSLTKKVVVTK